LFRQAIVNKGRNRDTSWFSIIDGDWNGGLNDAYLRWLAEDNFDADGAQKLRLSELTAPFVHARGPDDRAARVSSGGEERFQLFGQTL
jgi:hypothetical protein